MTECQGGGIRVADGLAVSRGDELRTIAVVMA